MDNTTKRIKINNIKNRIRKLVKNDIILEFENEQELFDYINFNCPEIEKKCESIGDVLDEFGCQYFFTFDNRFYLVEYDEDENIAYDVAHLEDEEEEDFLIESIKYGFEEQENEFYAYMLGKFDTSINAFVTEANRIYQLVYKKDFYTRSDQKIFDRIEEVWNFGNDEEHELLTESINELTNGNFNCSLESLTSKLYPYKQFEYLEIGCLFVDVPNTDSIDRLFIVAQEYNQSVKAANCVVSEFINNKEINEIMIGIYLGELKNKLGLNNFIISKSFDRIVNQFKKLNIKIIK